MDEDQQGAQKKRDIGQRHYSPYGIPDQRERDERKVRLLASYARIWDLQVATYCKNHRSITDMDGDARAEQRRRARVDLTQLGQKSKVNWVRGLRGGPGAEAQGSEITIGRLNPVTFALPPDSVNVALNTLANMPDYVPVSERLPSRLRRRNKEYVAELSK